MKKWIVCLLIGCLFLFSATSCDEGKKNNETGGTNAPETTGQVTEEPGEPFDPNNEYANDNNAYYNDAWKR